METISPTIMKAPFNGNPAVNVISCYKRDAIGSVYNDSTNENGQRLLDYLQD